MITFRGTVYYLNRRVPKDFRDVEPRDRIFHSLKTGDRKEAERRARNAWAELERGWRAQQSGDLAAAEHSFEIARRRARDLGVPYKALQEVVDLPIDDVTARLRQVKIRSSDASSMLGLAEEPVPTVSGLLDYAEPLYRDKLIGKSEDQIRRWRNPRKKVIADFLDVVGDRRIDELTTDDMSTYFEWLVDLVEEGRILPGTANKQTTYIGSMLRRIKKLKLRSLDLSFLPDVKLAEGRSRTRPPFTTAWLRDKILAPGALGGLNDQARDCVLIMINSGMRPSEIVGLRPEHFALDQPIPLVQVKPDGKQLKNNHSERSVPMAGVSLDAARRRAAQGFPRYFAKDAISAVVNKYMRENGLMESVDHTLYSIRHAFEDRLIVAGVDERVRSDLFGHSIQRERYGAGGGDDVRFAAIRSIAL